jgi:hypothetical protein
VLLVGRVAQTPVRPLDLSIDADEIATPSDRPLPEPRIDAASFANPLRQATSARREPRRAVRMSGALVRSGGLCRARALALDLAE